MSIQQAVEKLNAGDVVAIPTETVYGLAASIAIPTAIDKIFSVKKRPFFDPLIVHVSAIEQAKKIVAEWSPAAEILAKAFWPGPLTLVMQKATSVSDKITSGLGSVGIRMPDHKMALEIIQQTGPLAAPSANLFGKTSPTTAEHVKESFADEVMVVDGGACRIGIESTVLLLEAQGYKILRPGMITKNQIQDELLRSGLFLEEFKTVQANKSPGHTKHHYMPDKPLIVGTQNFSDQKILDEVKKQFAQIPDEIEEVKIVKPDLTKNLKITRMTMNPDPKIAARELYSELRLKGNALTDLIYLQVPELFFQTTQNNPWEALVDRVVKAATIRIN